MPDESRCKGWREAPSFTTRASASALYCDLAGLHDQAPEGRPALLPTSAPGPLSAAAGAANTVHDVRADANVPVRAKEGSRRSDELVVPATLAVSWRKSLRVTSSGVAEGSAK